MGKRDVLVAARARMLLASGEARRIRERAGASRSDIADAIGVKPAAIAHWEAGIRRPRTASAARYGELLAELADMAAAEDR
jgi:transcriptional regulator with XRE-family HTH domain